MNGGNGNNGSNGNGMTAIIMRYGIGSAIALLLLWQLNIPDVLNRLTNIESTQAQIVEQHQMLGEVFEKLLARLDMLVLVSQQECVNSARTEQARKACLNPI